MAMGRCHGLGWMAAGLRAACFLCLEAATDAKPVAYRLYSNGTLTAYRCIGISTGASYGPALEEAIGKGANSFFLAFRIWEVSHLSHCASGPALVQIGVGRETGVSVGGWRGGVCSWQTTIRGREFPLYETFAWWRLSHKRQAGAQKKKLGADLQGSVPSALWVDDRTNVWNMSRA